MKKSLFFSCFFLFASVLLGSSIPSFSMTIDPMDNAASLAQSLVGSGVTLSNVTYTGAEVASGYFSGGLAAGIGIDSGIVLTSGLAANLDGTSNTLDGITGQNLTSGDADLNALIPGYTTIDATVLEFDFVSTEDSANFRYVFGSEEYNEFVGYPYNDVFGFFIGPADGRVNVALVTDTDTGESLPVAINNVNNSQNSDYYNDNERRPDGTSPYPFEYDGFTNVLTASILGLTPNETYHLKLAIADAGDYQLDSGVFIETGSFSSGSGGTEPGGTEPPAPVPEPATMILLAVGVAGLAGFRKGFKK